MGYGTPLLAWSEAEVAAEVRDAYEVDRIVFDMFRQVDGSPTRRFGGSVSVESEIDGGTRFLVRIPCQRLDDVRTERA